MMKLKIKHIAVLTLISSLGLLGCEDLKFGNAFLEKPLSTGMTIDSVYAHKIYAEQALVDVYHSLPDYLPQEGRLSWGIMELISDLGEAAKAGGVSGYYDGSLSSTLDGCYPCKFDVAGSESASNGMSMGPISGIRKAWSFIENVDRVPDMTDQEKSVRKAEAKMIIAIHYSQLVRYFGGMPWIDHAYKPEDDMQLVRLTLAETVDKTVGLLDEVAKVLPWKVDADNDGRLTAAGALAIKARLLLFVASPLFNSDKPYTEGEASAQKLVWYGNYEAQRWQRALDAGLEFLTENEKNSSYYQLVTNQKTARANYASGYFDRFNRETIISTRRFDMYNTGSKWFQQIKFGMGQVSAHYADMFEMADGTPFDWDNPIHGANPFFDAKGNPVRDPRLYETLIVNGDVFQGRPCEIWVGGREACKGGNGTFQANGYNGYGMRKFQRDLKNEVANKFYSCPFIRLPEVYLGIAEAMNELNKANQADKFGRTAYDYVNIVRDRVQMPQLDQTKHTSGVALREAILHERVVEFGYEEVRYHDMNRWKRADWLQVPHYRLHIVSPDKGKTLKFTKETDLKVLQRVWATKWDNRYYLVPIPLKEINKKYGLIQNSGWE